MTDVKGLVDSLLKEAVFRRARREYQPALASLEHAIELDSMRSEAHRELGRTLSYFAAESDDPTQKKALLDTAEASLQRAAELPGASLAMCFHDLAWLYDERGDFDKAIDFYRRAQEANRQEDALEDSALSYNWACALAKAGRVKEALEVLEPVIKDAWQWAEKDADFKALRESAEWRPRFQNLIESARIASKR